MNKEGITQEELNKILNESEEIKHDFDSKTVIELIKEINDVYLLNQKQRKQYPTSPDKYLKSEEQLNEDITVLQRLAAYPLLIPIFITEGGIELLCSLLSHPNTDIVNPVINLIEEITQGDFLQELEDPKSFLELFLSNDLFTLLVNQLKLLFQESTEDNEQYKSDILSIIENFIEIYPLSVEILGQKTELLTWLISSVKYSESIDVKVFSSEILQSLLQFSSDNQARFARISGIPHLVNVIASVKDSQSKGGLYDEFSKNIINCICTSLFNKANQEMFSKADGIMIMIDCMRDNGIYRHLAIKVLNYALQNNKENCALFVDSNGLSVLFPYFMGKGLKKYSESALLGEEHCIEIIVNLFKYVQGVEMDRLLYKFKEERYEKCQRLMKVYYKYERKMINIKKEEEDDEENDAEEEEEEGSNINKDEYTFQLINILCLILLTQTTYEDIKRNLIKHIGDHNENIISKMKSIIKKMIESIGEEDTTELRDSFSYKKFLTNLI